MNMPFGIRGPLRLALAVAAASGAAGGFDPLHAQREPTLAELAAQAAEQLRAQLPQRVDEVTTLTNLTAEGTRFIYEMAISAPIPRDRLEAARSAIQAQNQTGLCANAESGAFIRRGGSMRHIYTEAGGARFETLVAACP